MGESVLGFGACVVAACMHLHKSVSNLDPSAGGGRLLCRSHQQRQPRLQTDSFPDEFGSWDHI